MEPHVTLLAEELIGRHAFDNSTDRGSDCGSNHWGKSGNTKADRGLRPWLNSTGIHTDEGFYNAFSDDFKSVLLTTVLPNKDWEKGNIYVTEDQVFVPSTTELGNVFHISTTYRIGIAYPYFKGTGFINRCTKLGEEDNRYWSRSPYSRSPLRMRAVCEGMLYFLSFSSMSGGCHFHSFGVRPALNLKSDTLVSEITN